MRNGLAALVLVLTAGAVAPALADSPRHPLLMPGKQTVFQRVLTRPGAQLYPTASDTDGKPVPAFQPFYVFARTGDWIQVGPSEALAPTGWLEAKTTVAWKQNIVGAFTNPAGRSRQILFKDEASLRAFMESENIQSNEKRILAEADNGQGDPQAGVVAVEPKEFVDIHKRFYLMPILDFKQDLHPLDYEPDLLMDVASVPLQQNPAPNVQATSDQFDAGIVFVFDTTMSMDRYIRRTQDAMERIVGDLKNSDIGKKVNFGIVAFRDNTAASPGLVYRTKVLLPLKRRDDQSAVIDAIHAAAKVATVSSPGFNEDSLAGVEDAIDLTNWNGDNGNPFNARYIILITDAGPKSPDDPNARSRIGPAELQLAAQEKGIALMTLHLETPEGGAAQHDYAARQYQQLSRFQGQSFYYPIANGSPDAFQQTVTQLVTALSDTIRVAENEAPKAKPDEGTDKVLALGRAMQLAYLGARKGTEAPDVIEGWISEKAVEDPRAVAIEPRLLVTKNQLATMAELLRNILRIAEQGRGAADANDFFNQVQTVVSQMAQNPDRVVNTKSQTLGGSLEFLEDLPYHSQIMNLTPQRWSQSAMERKRILDSLGQRLAQYQKWLLDPASWTSLYKGSPDGDYVFAMPFATLP